MGRDIKRGGTNMPLWQRAATELVGTFWLVLGGCGAAVLDAAFPGLGIGHQGVALAFGLTVLTMAFAIGHVSGCHLNPAVSVGLVVGRRFKASELPAYVVAQVVGAALAAGTLFHLVSIPVTNTSVNPARSTGPALVVGGWALEQLWMFWIAPLIGGALGAVVYGLVATPRATPAPAVARR